MILEGMKILDTTGYSVLYTRQPLVFTVIIIVVCITLLFFIIGLKDVALDSPIEAIMVGILSLTAAIVMAMICISICSFIVEPGAPAYQMEVCVEDGYKFDAGFLEEWGIKKQITDNVYILERRRYSGR